MRNLPPLLARLGLVSLSAIFCSTPGSAQNLSYQGGAIVSSPQIVVMYWGPNVDPTLQSNLPGMYNTLLSGPWMNVLKQYSTAGLTPVAGGPSSGQTIQSGSFVKAVTITPSNLGDATFDAISGEIQNQVISGAIPAPTFDPQGFPQTIYVVYLPPGLIFTDPNLGTSCKNFDEIEFNLIFPGTQVPTILFSDLSAPRADSQSSGLLWINTRWITRSNWRRRSQLLASRYQTLLHQQAQSVGTILPIRVTASSQNASPRTIFPFLKCKESPYPSSGRTPGGDVSFPTQATPLPTISLSPPIQLA